VIALRLSATFCVATERYNNKNAPAHYAEAWIVSQFARDAHCTMFKSRRAKMINIMISSRSLNSFCFALICILVPRAMGNSSSSSCSDVAFRNPVSQIALRTPKSFFSCFPGIEPFFQKLLVALFLVFYHIVLLCFAVFLLSSNPFWIVL